MSHRYLILGLLIERPMTGYDIKKHVSASLQTIMNASYGTLYPTLHKLLDQGAVGVQEVPQKGRPSKKVYHITDNGRDELNEWLKRPAAADQVRREFLLKLYLSNNLPPEDLQNLLESRRDEIQSILATLHKESCAEDNPRQEWVRDYARSIYQAEMDWLRRLESDIVVM